MPHSTIATDPGLARTQYELGGGSFGWRATLKPSGELTTDSVNEFILQSTIVCVCRVVAMEFTGVWKPHDKSADKDV